MIMYIRSSVHFLKFDVGCGMDPFKHGGGGLTHIYP